MASQQSGEHQNKAHRHGCKETQPDQRRSDSMNAIRARKGVSGG
jgi:hypothetical protein